MMKENEIIERIEKLPQVKKVTKEGNEKYDVMIKTDGFWQQNVEISFYIKNENFMFGGIFFDEYVFIGLEGLQEDALNCEENSFRGRPEDVIKSISALIDKYYPEKYYDAEKDEYVIALPFKN